MKKKKVNTLFLFFFSVFPILLMVSGLYFCSRSTGFNLDKISSSLDYNENWEVGPLSKVQREHLIQQVFPQTYRYLASGSQCYSFISEDGQYILKFFKMQSFVSKGWFENFPFSLFSLFGFKQQTNNPLFSERIFASYKDAYLNLQRETGLIYLHLNKTCEFKMDLFLIDKEGREHTIDLDTIEFVVQKKAIKIYDHLENLIHSHQLDELRSSIRSFLQLIAKRCEMGFADQTLNIRNNYGFIGNEAIQFDCAMLARDSSMKYPLNVRQEVLEVAERLNEWARMKFPDAILFIQDEAQKIINRSF